MSGAMESVAWIIGLAFGLLYVLPWLVKLIGGNGKSTSSDIGAAPIAAPDAAPPGNNKLIWLAVIVGVAAIAYYLTRPDFTEQQIEAVKASIREEFSKRPGVSVLDVMLIRKSARELAGYAKIKVNGNEITKTCASSMADDGSKYLWSCGN